MKTAEGKCATVRLYIVVKTVGAITRANACKRPTAPRTCPVRSGGTCAVIAEDRVGEPIPAKAAIMADTTSISPVIAVA